MTIGNDVVFIELDNGGNLFDEFDGDNVTGFSSMIVDNARTVDNRCPDDS